jgi:cellulose synthase/poly-beta-1,6-N-acetylglucosamine synthase-like glycosyltransferase
MIVITMLNAWFVVMVVWWAASFSRRPYVPIPDTFNPGVIVVIPARNEVGIIYDSVRSWLAQSHVSSVIVLANGCTDGTAAAARSAGARVIESAGGSKREALRDMWRGVYDESFGSCDEERYYVFADADNVPVMPDTAYQLAWAASRSPSGVAQSDVRGSGGNWLQDIAAVERGEVWAVMEWGRCALGGSAFLGGTGMCMSASRIRRDVDKYGVESGYPVYSVSEDLAYSVRLAADGESVAFAPDAVLLETEPFTIKSLWRQRLRWARGYVQVIESRDMGRALFGRQWGSAVFLLGAELVSLVSTFFMVLLLVTVPLLGLRVFALSVTWGMVFAVAGGLRSGRWRGIIGYGFIMVLNIVALWVGLLTYGSMAWVRTLHYKGGTE